MFVDDACQVCNYKIVIASGIEGKVHVRQNWSDSWWIEKCSKRRLKGSLIGVDVKIQISLDAWWMIKVQ